LIHWLMGWRKGGRKEESINCPRWWGFFFEEAACSRRAWIFFDMRTVADICDTDGREDSHV
jgi:hypothetical protein